MLVYNVRMLRIKRYAFIFLLTCILVPAAALAHEVYVLPVSEVSTAMSMPSPNPFAAVPAQEDLFLLCGAIAIVLFLCILALSVHPLFERVFDPMFKRMKKYAPFIGRITLGFSLFSSGYYHAMFGPELPLATALPTGWAETASVFLMILGALILVGCLTRIVALVGIVLFGYMVVHYHLYMLTYANYLGEMLLALILGGGMWSLDRQISLLRAINAPLERVGMLFEKYSFFILRLLFGASVFFASFYAKFLHSNLALDTVADYHLTDYFHFTPLFLVLGAFLVEAVIGACFFLGFQVRFAAILFTFFLTLSILFFGEAVWPHIILFGVNFALFAHGYDKYTLEMLLIQRKRFGEPVM